MIIRAGAGRHIGRLFVRLFVRSLCRRVKRHGRLGKLSRLVDVALMGASGRGHGRRVAWRRSESRLGPCPA